jgi:hypothetical protein
VPSSLLSIVPAPLTIIRVLCTTSEVTIEAGLARRAVGCPDLAVSMNFGFSRTLRAVVALRCMENAGTEKLEACAAVHGSFQHFQPVDLALDRARCPREIECSLDGGDVAV